MRSIEQSLVFGNAEIMMVHVEIKSNEVDLKFICNNINISISYLPTETGCSIKCFWNEMHLENRDFLIAGMEDLSNLLANQSNLIPSFDLRYEGSESSEFIENSLGILVTLLKFVEKPIKVEKFLMDIIDQDQALKTLPLIDSNFVKEITLINRKEKKGVLEIHKLLDLEQWRTAKKIHVKGFIVSCNNFDQFTKINII